MDLLTRGALGWLLAAGHALPQSVPYVTVPGSHFNWVASTTAAAANDVLHVAWVNATPTYSTVQYSRSTDHGRSWLTSPTGLVVGTFTPLWFAASGQNVCLFHQAAPVNCSSSIDGGLTWRPPTPLLPADATLGTFVAIGTTLHAVLFASTTGTVTYQRSTDGGLTWLANPIVLGSGWTTAQLALSANTLHAAWPAAAGIQHARSTDGGVTWQLTPVLGQPMTQNGGIALVATGTSVCIGYQPSSRTTVSLLRSTDDGVTWQPQPNLGTGLGLGGTADGNQICFVWMTGGTPATVQIAHSADAGQTWQVSTQYFNQLLTSNTFVTSLVCRGSTIALSVTCIDWYISMRTFPGAVLVSRDQGLTWLLSQPIESLLTRGVSAARLLPLTDSLVQVWASVPAVNGIIADEVRATLLFGYQPYGPAKPGTGNLAPRLDGNGEPHTGSTAGVAMSNARGGSPALIAASFAGPASIPFGSGLMLVQPPTINLAGITNGTQGAPGAGTLAFPIAIPVGAAFRNRHLDFQGFVLDPVAADGFAATAGLELWTF
jgi:hypothetical protein